MSERWWAARGRLLASATRLVPTPLQREGKYGFYVAQLCFGWYMKWHRKVHRSYFRRRPGLALKSVEDGFAVEQKTNKNLTLVLGKICIAPAGEGQAVYHHNLGVTGHNVFHGNFSTLS